MLIHQLIWCISIAHPLASPEGIGAQARDLCSPPSLAAAFCLCSTSDPKPKRRNGMNCIMVLVVTYLVLLTVGAGLLVIQGKASESCLLLPWVTMWTHLTENSGSGESPGATAAHLLGESSQALGDQGGGGGEEKAERGVCVTCYMCVCMCVWRGGRYDWERTVCFSSLILATGFLLWDRLCSLLGLGGGDLFPSLTSLFIVHWVEGRRLKETKEEKEGEQEEGRKRGAGRASPPPPGSGWTVKQ